MSLPVFASRRVQLEYQAAQYIAASRTPPTLDDIRRHCGRTPVEAVLLISRLSERWNVEPVS